MRPSDRARASSHPSTDELVQQHLYLIQHVVNDMSARFPRHVERQELWNAGALGLVEAAQRFDPAAGIPFARFAAMRVRGAILDSTRSRDWASRSVRREARELDAADEELQRRLGRQPTTGELAEALGVDAHEVETRRAAAERACLLHLDHPTSSDEDHEPATLGELIRELEIERLPDQALEHRELIGTLRSGVAHLPERLREVLERYYYRGEYLRDIAASLEVTEARISQLRGEAVTALRAYFAHLFDDESGTGPSRPASTPRRDAYVAEAAQATNWRARLEAAERSAPVRAPGRVAG